MSQPRVPQDLKDYLTERNLTLWHCLHPITMDYEWAGNGPKRGRADKTRVEVQLAGPQLIDFSPWGYGANVREAVDNALNHPAIRSLQTGLGGALARCEEEMRRLIFAIQVEALDGDVPF